VTPKRSTVVVLPVLRQSTGMSYTTMSTERIGGPYGGSGQWAAQCRHPDCGDPRDGKIISVGAVRKLIDAEADQHRLGRWRGVDL
jgi:hypothetical protein